MGFARRCVVWGRVRGVLMGLACMRVCLLDSESKGFHSCQEVGFLVTYTHQLVSYLLTYVL